MKQTFELLLVGVFLFVPAATGFPESVATIEKAAGDGVTLESSVLSAAGAPTSSRNFQGNGTLGQPTPIGLSQRPAMTLSAGFWYGWRRMFDPSDVPLPPDLVNLLMQNNPNPFNPQTTIRFVVAQQSPVKLEVFDLRGRLVRVLIQENQPAGDYKVHWDGTDHAGHSVPSGTYFYRLQIGDFSATNKMLLLK